MVEKIYFEEVDLAKGLAMVLAVVGHSLPDASKDFWISGPGAFPEFTYHWIYSFHMALFFFFAGFLFIPKINRGSLKDIVVKRFKRLMVPYFFYSLSYLVLKTIFSSLADHPLDSNAFLMMFLGVSPSFGCWFLWTLFVMSVVLALFRKAGPYWILVISVIEIVLAVLMGDSVDLGHVTGVLKNSIWMALGGIAALHYSKIKPFISNIFVALAGFALLTAMQFVDGAPIWFGYLKTATGIVMASSAACIVAETAETNPVHRLLSLVGKYCMDIYLLSMFVLVPMRIIYVNIGLMEYVNYYVWVLLSVAVGIFIPYIVSKYFVRKKSWLRALLIGG